MLALAAYILKLEPYGKINMTPAQGWHANLESVPYFYIKIESRIYCSAQGLLLNTVINYLGRVKKKNRYISMYRRRQWHPTPVLLPGKSHGRRSLEGCSPWGRWGSDTIERLHFHFSLSCIGEGNGNPLHCSCLENPRDGGAWWAAVYGVAQSRTQLKWLSSSISMYNWIKWQDSWHKHHIVNQLYSSIKFLKKSEDEISKALSSSVILLKNKYKC